MCGCVCAYLSLLALLEESLLANLLLGLVGGEVLGLRDLLDLLGVEAGDVDLERGGDNVARVDPAQGNAVDLEGAGDEEDALVEGLEEDDALAAEAAGNEDQDGAGLQGLAGSPGAEGLADLCCGLVSANMLTDLMPFSCSSPRRIDGCVDRRRGGRTGEFKISRPMPPTGGLGPRAKKPFVRHNLPTIPNAFPSKFLHRPPRRQANQCIMRQSQRTHLLGLGVILGRVPLLGLLRGGGDLPGRLAEGLLLDLGRHVDSLAGGRGVLDMVGREGLRLVMQHPKSMANCL